jgi:CheY-like chemotaxis protein
MPEMDGFRAAAEIRRMEAAGGGVSGRVPILAVTASVMESDHRRCLASGMDFVITKPAKTADLGRALVRAMHEAAAHAQCNPV